MNNSEKYTMVCEQFGSLKHLNPPMKIDWMPTLAWKLLNEWGCLDDTCLVYLHAENEIGIADRGQSGYTKTPCVVREGINGQDAVDWFNKHILGQDKTESMKIVMSTMRKK